jgi:hypothetical protein
MLTRAQISAMSSDEVDAAIDRYAHLHEGEPWVEWLWDARRRHGEGIRAGALAEEQRWFEGDVVTVRGLTAGQQDFLDSFVFFAGGPFPDGIDVEQGATYLRGPREEIEAIADVVEDYDPQESEFEIGASSFREVTDSMIAFGVRAKERTKQSLLKKIYRALGDKEKATRASVALNRAVRGRSRNLA